MLLNNSVFLIEILSVPLFFQGPRQNQAAVHSGQPGNHHHRRAGHGPHLHQPPLQHQHLRELPSGKGCASWPFPLKQHISSQIPNIQPLFKTGSLSMGVWGGWAANRMFS